MNSAPTKVRQNSQKGVPCGEKEIHFSLMSIQKSQIYFVPALITFTRT